MAVVERKRKSGTVYGVANDWNGKQAWELVGPSKREAESRDRAMKREIVAGLYQPKEGARAVTVGQAASAWAATRKNASAADEARLIRLYVDTRPWFAEMRLDDVRPAHVQKLVLELQAEVKESDPSKRRLSDKTIANLMGVLHLIFARGQRMEQCIRQPIQLEPGTLKRASVREREIYAAAEAVVLTRHHAIPWPIRVLNALCLFGGLREGEACGRRWRDLDEACGPLPAMFVRDQYDSKPLKTERPRVVPIHPELGRVLTEWAQEGFELYTTRPPTPDDFIVPNVSARAAKTHHTRSSYYKAFVKFSRAAGVRPRTLHATRHTFISLCRRGGARKDVLERVTHNARGDIVDGYTHFDWAPLCEAVSCLRLDAHPGLHRGPGNPGERGGPARRVFGTIQQASPRKALPQPASIPGASTVSD